VLSLRKNFGLKLLSLALALLGWAYVRFATNPVFALHFDQQLSVPIVAANLPVDFVAHFTEKQAVVTVATKRGEPPIKPDEIRAFLDLSNRAPGIYNVPVQLAAPNVTVQSLSPASVSLTIERVVDRVYRLDVHYVGDQKKDVVAGDVHLLPATVHVRGPMTSVAQLAAIHLDVPFTSGPHAFDAMVRPRAVDARGLEVDGIVVSPDLVRVRVAFIASAGTRHTR